MTAFRLGEETRLWGRSTDLCREGIGVTISGELTPKELVAIQIPLPKAKIVTVNASVRYCNQGHCGFEFCDLRNRHREAIQAACERLRKASGHTEVQGSTVTAVAGSCGSRQPQTLERSASRSATDIRHNDEFKYGDVREFNLIFLDLAYCVRWAEIPLLPYNFSKRASAV